MKLLGSSTPTNYPHAFTLNITFQNSFSFTSLIKIPLYLFGSSRDTNGSHSFIHQEVQGLSLCFLLLRLLLCFFSLTNHLVPLFQIWKKPKVHAGCKRRNNLKLAEIGSLVLFFFFAWGMSWLCPFHAWLFFLKKGKDMHAALSAVCLTCPTRAWQENFCVRFHGGGTLTPIYKNRGDIQNWTYYWGLSLRVTLWSFGRKWLNMGWDTLE